MRIEEKIIQFLFMESCILIYICDLQYCSEIPPPTSNGGKAKKIPTQRPCAAGEGHAGANEVDGF